MSIWGIVAVYNESNGFLGLADYIPEAPITFTAATAAIVGGWVFGASSIPDVCRYARSIKDVVIAGFGAFLIGCFGLQLEYP